MNMNMKPWLLASAVALALGTALPAQAVNMLFNGTLTEAPPCEINNNNDINVTFPTVDVSAVMDGSVAILAVPLNMNCTGNGRDVHLTLTGNGYSGNSDALAAVDNPNLGLMFYKDASGNTEWPITTPWGWVAGSGNAPTTVWVKQITTSSALAGGEFNATATLISAYDN